MSTSIATVVRAQSALSGSTTLATGTSTLIPLPELPITVRLGTIDDLPFIDELQKKNNKNLGFMHRATLEGKIKREEVLIAESAECCVLSAESNAKDSSSLSTGERNAHRQHSGLSTRVGYLIGNDRYFKRDELGAIFQLCVVPGRRRGLVGATLLKSLFERASYGCKLYCCWCAQDLEANHFWQAMGFVPVAFRSGAKKKLKGADGKRADRVHIFWQKRIRAGDTETPWWYPHQTGGGAIGEDRIVLPIPPSVHWSEVRSVVLPGQNDSAECCVLSAEENPDATSSPSTPRAKRERQPKVEAPQKPKRLRLTGMPSFYVPPPSAAKSKREKKSDEPKVNKVKQKNDPAKVKAARALRDMYLEEINRNPTLVSNGKYEVNRLVQPIQLDQKLLAA